MGNISVVSAGLLERLPWSVIAYPEEMRKDAEHVYISIADGKRKCGCGTWGRAGAGPSK